MRPVRWIVLYITIIFAVVSASAWQGTATGSKAGSSSSAKSGPAKTAGSAKTGSSAAAAPAGSIDINHASKADLQTLPGIGDAYANAIIKNRPYKNKTQLRSRNVIPDATYNKIKDKIIAKQ
jgi:DNA uptake protein ComE-like DNA-binding protein